MMNEFILCSDIHGNAPALQAVIDREGTDKEYLVLGDLHGLLAYPQEVVEKVQSLNGHFLAGNHDKAIFEHGEGHVVDEKLRTFELEHTRDGLNEAQQEWMRQLPYMKIIHRSGNRIALAHSYPFPEKASGYGSGGVTKKEITEIAPLVSNDYDWVMLGHTHEQYDLDVSKFGHDVRFVNPGSLGYEQTYSVVEMGEKGEVQHKSVEVDADVKGHVQEQLNVEGAPPVREWL